MKQLAVLSLLLTSPIVHAQIDKYIRPSERITMSYEAESDRYKYKPASAYVRSAVNKDGTVACFYKHPNPSGKEGGKPQLTHTYYGAEGTVLRSSFVNYNLYNKEPSVVNSYGSGFYVLGKEYCLNFNEEGKVTSKLFTNKGFDYQEVSVVSDEQVVISYVKDEKLGTLFWNRESNTWKSWTTNFRPLEYLGNSCDQKKYMELYHNYAEDLEKEGDRYVEKDYKELRVAVKDIAKGYAGSDPFEKEFTLSRSESGWTYKIQKVNLENAGMAVMHSKDKFNTSGMDMSLTIINETSNYEPKTTTVSDFYFDQILPGFETNGEIIYPVNAWYRLGGEATQGLIIVRFDKNGDYKGFTEIVAKKDANFSNCINASHVHYDKARKEIVFSTYDRAYWYQLAYKIDLGE